MTRLCFLPKVTLKQPKTASSIMITNFQLLMLIQTFISFIFGWTNFSHVANNKLSYSVSIGDTETLIYIEYQGSNWVSLSFGSTQPHFGVYSITYGKLSFDPDQEPVIFESILDNGETTGTLLKECNNGTHPTFCAKLISASYLNGITSIIIHRVNNQGFPYTYQFSNTRSYHSMQWAYSDYSIIWSDSTEHSRTTRSTLIQRVDTSSTTKSLCDYKTIRKQSLLNTDLSLALTLDFKLGIIEIELYSSLIDDVWFGIGWNSHSESDSFIVSTGYHGDDTTDLSMYNYYLHGFKVDYIAPQIPSIWDIQSLNIDYDKNEIAVIGKANMNDLQHTIIDPLDDTMILLIAWGNSSNYKFGYHGSQNHLIYEIDLDCHNDTISYPDLNDNNTDVNIDIDRKFTGKIDLIQQDGISIISISIDIINSENIIRIELYGLNNVWFGINWGDHYNGDSLLYTTGLFNEESEPSVFDYALRGKLIGSQDENFKDSQQDWNIESLTRFEENNSVVITCSRLLMTNDTEHDFPIDFDKNEMILYVSHGVESAGNPYQYAYHGSNYWIVKIDLINGISVNIDESGNVYNTTDHMIFMMIAICVVLPVGLLWTFNSKIKTQINKISVIIGYLLIFCGFFVKLVSLNGLKMATAHGISGIVFIVLYTLIILIGCYCHYFKDKMIVEKWDTNKILIVLLAYGYIQIILGLSLLYKWEIVVGCVAGYFVILFVLFVHGYIKSAHMKESAEEQSVVMMNEIKHETTS